MLVFPVLVVPFGQRTFWSCPFFELIQDLFNEFMPYNLEAPDRWVLDEYGKWHFWHGKDVLPRHSRCLTVNSCIASTMSPSSLSFIVFPLILCRHGTQWHFHLNYSLNRKDGIRLVYIS